MAKYKVALRQFVEQLAVIEVEAENPDDARREANNVYDTNLYATIRWEPGDDAEPVEVYAVLNEANEVEWER